MTGIVVRIFNPSSAEAEAYSPLSLRPARCTKKILEQQGSTQRNPALEIQNKQQMEKKCKKEKKTNDKHIDPKL